MRAALSRSVPLLATTPTALSPAPCLRGARGRDETPGPPGGSAKAAQPARWGDHPKTESLSRDIVASTRNLT